MTINTYTFGLTGTLYMLLEVSKNFDLNHSVGLVGIFGPNA